MTEHDLKTELRWMAQGAVNPRAAAAALERIEALEADVAELHERLEDNRVYDGEGNRIDVEPGSIPDGIDCRNETIKLLDARIEALEARAERAEAVVRFVRDEARTLTEARDRARAALEAKP